MPWSTELRITCDNAVHTGAQVSAHSRRPFGSTCRSTSLPTRRPRSRALSAKRLRRRAVGSSLQRAIAASMSRRGAPRATESTIGSANAAQTASSFQAMPNFFATQLLP
jgi:hypothetical protein